MLFPFLPSEVVVPAAAALIISDPVSFLVFVLAASAGQSERLFRSTRFTVLESARVTGFEIASPFQTNTFYISSSGTV